MQNEKNNVARLRGKSAYGKATTDDKFKEKLEAAKNSTNAKQFMKAMHVQDDLNSMKEAEDSI